MPSRPATPARLEAFSDGVIAVIITIMVLELKVPHENGLAGFRAILPTLFVYFLSFSFTGIYWINHHYLVRRVEISDHLILYANLAFLFFLSLLPFFTNYVLEKQEDAFSVGLYAVSMVITGFSFLLLRIAINHVLRRTGEIAEEDTATQRKHLVSLLLYAVAIGLAHLFPHVALLVVALVTLVWIVPTAHIRVAGTPPRLESSDV